MSDTMKEQIARAVCRVQLNGGDPDQPAIRWNGTDMEPQEFPAWRDYLDEANAVVAIVESLERRIEELTALADAEAARCARDVCFFCDCRAGGYHPDATGPNNAGRWTHQKSDGSHVVMCIASNIWARRHAERRAAIGLPEDIAEREQT